MGPHISKWGLRAFANLVYYPLPSSGFSGEAQSNRERMSRSMGKQRNFQGGAKELGVRGGVN